MRKIFTFSHVCSRYTITWCMQNTKSMQIKAFLQSLHLKINHYNKYICFSKKKVPVSLRQEPTSACRRRHVRFLSLNVSHKERFLDNCFSSSTLTTCQGRCHLSTRTARLFAHDGLLYQAKTASVCRKNVIVFNNMIRNGNCHLTLPNASW